MRYRHDPAAGTRGSLQLPVRLLIPELVRVPRNTENVTSRSPRLGADVELPARGPDSLKMEMLPVLRRSCVRQSPGSIGADS